jgi:DNA-binding protein YbaB
MIGEIKINKKADHKTQQLQKEFKELQKEFEIIEKEIERARKVDETVLNKIITV